MAEYKDIKGFKVQTVSTDPAASIIATGVWASGGNLNTARAAGGGAGVQTAVIAISGIVTNAPSVSTVNNESYDGSTWTEVNNVNTARLETHAVGSATAALLFGGQPPYTNATESWDGTNWTTVSSLNTPRGGHTGFGTSTAGLCISGLTAGDALTGNVESWNGSAWTEITDVNQGRAYISSSTNAPQSDGIVFGGVIFPGPFTAATESWNGSAWTEVNDLNTAIANGSGAGISTSALMIAGSAPAITNTTEAWDGTNWSTASNQANSLAYKNRGGGGASNSVAITFSGSNSPSFTTPTFVTSTEEWTTTPAPSFQQENLGQVFYNSTSNAFKVTKTVTGTGAWASGGTVNTGRQSLYSTGSQTANLIYSGETTVNVTNVESYNGTSWTEITDVNTALRSGASAGTSTSALKIDGYTGTAASGTVESWNGTSWTEIAELNTSRLDSSAAGISNTAAIIFGGSTTPGFSPVANTESWNGTSWTEVNDLNTATSSLRGGGTQTSALATGGYAPGRSTKTESWDGTSWTEVNDLNLARNNHAYSGSNNTNGLVFAGDNPGAPTTVNTEFYDGTSWTEVNNLATGKYRLAGSSNIGTSTSALASAGLNSSDIDTATTEEWNAPDVLINTLTTS